MIIIWQCTVKFANEEVEMIILKYSFYNYCNCTEILTTKPYNKQATTLKFRIRNITNDKQDKNITEMLKGNYSLVKVIILEVIHIKENLKLQLCRPTQYL